MFLLRCAGIILNAMQQFQALVKKFCWQISCLTYGRPLTNLLTYLCVNDKSIRRHYHKRVHSQLLQFTATNVSEMFSWCSNVAAQITDSSVQTGKILAGTLTTSILCHANCQFDSINEYYSLSSLFIVIITNIIIAIIIVILILIHYRYHHYHHSWTDCDGIRLHEIQSLVLTEESQRSSWNDDSCRLI